jgi:hypothetical protein
MNKRNRKKRVALNRATTYPIGNGLMYVPGGQKQGISGQVFYGSQASIPTGQAALFSPGIPLYPQPNVNPLGQPIQYSFPVAWNTFPTDRTSGNPDIPSFQQLRSLAKLYSGIGLCERTWFDLVPRMKLKIDLKPEYVNAGADSKDYQTEISYFMAWFESPDKMHDLHSWIRMALREQTQVDELYIYKRKKRGGGLYALELVAGDQMKPLLDDWGKIPQPPSFAYQQYPWGLPGAWFRSDEMIHYQESPAADNPYGQSRVERIIMLVNQALRKQRKDLSYFTEGNIPQGMMLVPDNATWTPDQIDAFEQAWNALLAGNATQQVRMRFTQPGMKYQAFEQYALDPTFDKFLINISVAAYGLSMQDVAFTDDVNRSTGVSQQDMTYRRTIDPLASVYASFITSCINNDFDPDLHGDMFVATFGGFEEEDDISELSGAYASLVSSGILGVTNAGKLLKLPDDPNAPYIGRIFVTKDGPVFLDDMASDKMRNAQMQSQLATFASAGQPKPAPGQQRQSGQQDDEEDDTENKQNNKKQDEGEPEQQRQIKASDLYSLDDDDEEEIEIPDDEESEDEEEEDPESDQEDAEWEEEIAQLLKSDESEPFTVLERHSPGGHDHDQKTHGDGSHPAYGVKHDKSPQARQAMQAEVKADKAKAQQETQEAHAKAQAAKVKVQQEAQKDAAEKKAAIVKAKAKAQKLAVQKKSAAAKLAAQKAKAHLQKQAAAAKAKTARMAAATQKKAQAAATKAAKSTAQSAKAQVHAALKAAKAQQKAAKTLQSLTNTIGSKAQLYNALSARKISKTWTAQDSAAAQAIASDLHGLMNAVNSHLNEADATSLLNSLQSAIGRLQGQKGMTQARASVLEKLVSQAKQQMSRSVLADEEDFDESEYYEVDEEDLLDETDEQEQDEERRYTISELLQLLSQQTKTQTANEANGTHIERPEEDRVVDTGRTRPHDHGVGEQRGTSPTQNDAAQDYRKWRQRAMDDVKAGRVQRGFTTTLIPPDIHKWISDELVECSTPDEVRSVFNRARDTSFFVRATEQSGNQPIEAHWQDSDVTIQKMLADLQKQGIQTVTWKAHHGACDECALNEGQTVPLGSRFASGAYLIPNHNHCICEWVDDQGRRYELNETADGYKQITHERSANAVNPTYLFLDIDGVFSIANAGLSAIDLYGKEAWPIPQAGTILKAIDQDKQLKPIWMTNWGQRATGWNDRAGLHVWDVWYPLTLEKDEAGAQQLYPDLDKKALAIQYCMHVNNAQSAIWLQDDFSPEEQEWAERVGVRLVNANEEPYHSLLLSEDESSVQRLMDLIHVGMLTNRI